MKKVPLILLFLTSWIFVAYWEFSKVLSGNIPFWYDPARDMLMGWDNLHKLTLIGPTSGIPGVFYGPHWIWMLSFGELFSKDPRIVTLVVQTMPYLILFPAVLFLFAKVFDKLTVVLLWTMFAYTDSVYFNSLWSPHPAPLFYLLAIYLLIMQDFSKVTKKTLLWVGIIGFLEAFAIQLQISFSIAFSLGTMLFLLMSFGRRINWQHRSSTILVFGKVVGCFMAGFAIVYLPVAFFEARHGFFQTKAAIKAVTHGGAVVGQLHGLTKPQIITAFLNQFAHFLQIPFTPAVFLVIVFLCFIGILYFTKGLEISLLQKRLLAVLGCLTVGFLGLYLTARNPIWIYHFIGADILALLLIGFVLAKIKPLQYVLIIWLVLVSITQYHAVLADNKINPLSQTSLFTKEYFVKTILKDAGDTTFAVYAYSPSIYTYEYTYIFHWLGQKDFSYDPSQIKKEKVVYLIAPSVDTSVIADFISYRTPAKEYKTVKTWHIADGTTILKRIAL